MCFYVMPCLCFRKTDSQAARVSSILAPSLASILPRLELEWEKLQRNDDVAILGLSAAGLLEAWRKTDGARWRKDDADLIAYELERIFRMIDVDGNGTITFNEFRHYVLLKATLPLQIQYLVDLTHKRAQVDKRFVESLVEDFTAADKDLRGKLKLEDFKKILIRRTGTMVHSESFGDSDEISYPEYLGVMLGRKRQKVVLLYYDISSKATKVFSRMLFGKKIEGIWHTSLLLFDKEWWYGGDIFRSNPFMTPFGSPVKQVELGATYFTQTELFNFITQHLQRRFTSKTYDVFDNNCNNFTNSLSQFLCGKTIPQEVLDLPRDLMNGGIARIFRGPLNRWLGGFGKNSAPDEETLELVLEALAKDKRLFRWKGKTVEVTSEMKKSKLTDIRFLKKGEFVEVKNVELAELEPIDEIVDQDLHFIAISALDDAYLRDDVASKSVTFNPSNSAN